MRKIEKSKDAVSLNISELLERGEKVELLLETTIALEEEAQVFKKTHTRALKNALYQKNMKMTAFAATVVVVVVVVVIFTMRAFFHGEN
jgi:hypothetical protein